MIHELRGVTRAQARAQFPNAQIIRSLPQGTIVFERGDEALYHWSTPLDHEAIRRGKRRLGILS